MPDPETEEANVATQSTAMTATLALLRNPPDRLPARDGVLDLLAGADDQPRGDAGAGPIQRAWESGPGAEIYRRAMTAARRFVGPLRPRLDELRLAGGETVLDLGCGPGDVTVRLADRVGPNGLVVGLDLSAPMLAAAATSTRRSTVAYLRADATDLPFADAVFDGVHSAYVAQLVPDPAAMFAEIARVLRPGGRLSLMCPGTPLGSDLPLVYRLAKVRLFSASELGDLAEGAGLVAVHARTLGPGQLGFSQLVTASKPR